MVKADVPPNELDRLQALRALRILDTPPEGRFDRITSLATRVPRAPKAYISMVHGDRVRRFSAEDIQIQVDLAGPVERELGLVDVIRLQQKLIETQRARLRFPQESS